MKRPSASVREASQVRGQRCDSFSCPTVGGRPQVHRGVAAGRRSPGAISRAAAELDVVPEDGSAFRYFVGRCRQAPRTLGRIGPQPARSVCGTHSRLLCHADRRREYHLQSVNRVCRGCSSDGGVNGRTRDLQGFSEGAQGSSDQGARLMGVLSGPDCVYTSWHQQPSDRPVRRVNHSGNSRRGVSPAHPRPFLTFQFAPRFHT